MSITSAIIDTKRVPKRNNSSYVTIGTTPFIQEGEKWFISIYNTDFTAENFAETLDKGALEEYYMLVGEILPTYIFSEEANYRVNFIICFGSPFGRAYYDKVF